MPGATADVRLDKAADELIEIANGLRAGGTTEQALKKLARPERRIAAAKVLLAPETDDEERARLLTSDDA
jgi:hypothetical protein